ncbi:hypothetical protein WOSG25_041470 [Weissella oryzae SG25]|uniref:Uncharacterized protein n=1 Tax=Weissella oryzae (strain DSM 25784 / JCM 18191 / LMG 30913 / SG25) TaxID=1329250 RepID=A0A069D054_WEIOS|nr:hypothetical protein [Weissella oryzae]GAK30706.1 hypothetical protein WOSG25_041470 [Weissella oryzae SG25]
MLDIQETIFTLKTLSESAESSKTLTNYLDGVDGLSVDLVMKLKSAQSEERNLLTTLLSKVKKEQLYYVLSPVNKRDVLNDETLGLAFQERRFNFSTPLEDSHHKNRFTQSELDSLQDKLPGLNIEESKVRVEEYDNEHA